MFRKVVAVWVSLLIIVGSIVILVEIAPVGRSITTIYVDDVPGEWPGNPKENYTSIQIAIDAANDGDTIYVYSGTYYENVIINKSLSIIGENSENTIIDGSGGDRTVVLLAPNILFMNFTLTLSDSPSGLDNTMDIFSHNNIIRNCIFSNVPNFSIYCSGKVNNTIIENNFFTGSYANGIRALGKYFTNNIIANNTFEGGMYGIVAYRVDHFDDVTITNNTFIGIGTWNGISLILDLPSNSANNITINKNIFLDFEVGIFLYHTSNSSIFNNTIYNCTWYGIWMESGCSNNLIYHNNLVKNNAGSVQATDTGDNFWNNSYPLGGNYWSDYLGIDSFSGPNQDIPGSDGIGDTNYTIDSDTVDYYPLIEPFDIILPVQNIDKDTYYIEIQKAIDDADSGNTIFVSNGIYYENLIVNKSINLKGEDRDNTKIDGKDKGDVITVNSDWVNITGFNVENTVFYAGVLLNSVQYCKIFNNKISNCKYGVYLDYSNKTEIFDNNIPDNKFGIKLYHSSENSIMLNSFLSITNNGIGIHFSNDNVVISNIVTGITGIYVVTSLYNRFFNNIMLNCSFFIYGSFETFTTQEIPVNNTANNNPVYYYKNINFANSSVPTDAGQVILANVSWARIENLNTSFGTVGIELGYSSHNHISNNSCFNNYYGIYLYNNCDNNTIVNNSILASRQLGLHISSSNNNIIIGNIALYSKHTAFYFAVTNNNIIKDNTCSNNRWTGIHFQFCDNNIIQNNTISNNNAALFLDQTSYNRIFHNNFINNNYSWDSQGNNIWNDTYPSGGNFWSNYSGDDNYKGPNQDIPGADGIGDTPYNDIRGGSGSTDYYPLMSPIGYDIYLYKGWNFLSFPNIQPDTNIGNVLFPLEGYFDAVQWYDISNASNPWKHNHTQKSQFLNDLDTIDHSMGFWIHITDPDGVLFNYPGTPPSINQTIQLHPGWNMVGYPSLTSYNRTTGLNNLTFDTHVDAIQWYDAITKTWHFMDQDDFFVPGIGYWVHSKVEIEWKVPL